MGYILHYFALIIRYTLKGVVGSVVYLVFCPIGLIVAALAALKYPVMWCADFLQYLLNLTEKIRVAKPVAFTFNGAVKEWRKRLEDYRDMPDYKVRKYAKRNLAAYREGSVLHKDARAYLFGCDKGLQDAIDAGEEIVEPFDFVSWE
jgi:hypothetical protein